MCNNYKATDSLQAPKKQTGEAAHTLSITNKKDEEVKLQQMLTGIDLIRIEHLSF